LERVVGGDGERGGNGIERLSIKNVVMQSARKCYESCPGGLK